MIATLCVTQLVYSPLSTMSRKKAGKKDLDSQFNAFLKESISSNEESIDTARLDRMLDPKKKKKPNQWWDNETDSESFGLGTGKSFIKQKKPETKATKEPETRLSNGHDPALSQDSLDLTSFQSRRVDHNAAGNTGVPALSLGTDTDTMTAGAVKGRPGRDTLNEIAEKERFFKDLEKNADYTVDYSHLNKELDREAGGTLDSMDSKALGKILNDDGQMNGEDGKMLDKVALMDSLDSTFGTKAADSREGKDRGMGTIPETGREDMTDTAQTGRHVVTGRRQESEEEEEGEDDIDGHNGLFESGTRGATDTRGAGGGITLKTGTAAYTDTEVEAYHAALKQQAGLATMEDIGGSMFKDSEGISSGMIIHGAGGKSGTLGFGPQDAGGAGSTDGTEGKGQSETFGHRPIAPPRTPRTKSGTEERTVDDIIKEVEELKHGTTDDRRPSVHFEDEEEEERGFALSPIHQHHDNARGLDLSPIPKVRTSHSHGFDLEMSTPDRPNKVSESTPLTGERVKSGKKKKKSGEKYSGVKSSGYGAKSTTSKSSPSRGKKVWSPAELHKNKQKGDVSGSIRDSQLHESVEAFARYIAGQIGKDGTVNNMHYKAQKQWSEDEPVLSSSQKLSGMDRERALMTEVKDWQQQWQEERKKHAKTKLELDHLEKMHSTKLDQLNMEHEKEIFKLKQENFLLAAKVHDEDGGNNVKLHKLLQEQAAGGGGISEEQQKMLEKEISEQEKLLAGYQQENERLYTEIKTMQKAVKASEDSMFRENQRLKTELRTLREQLSSVPSQQQHHQHQQQQHQHQQGGHSNFSASPLGVTGPVVAAGSGDGQGAAVLGAARIAALEAEIKQSKSREERLHEDIANLKKGRQEQDVQMEQMRGMLKQAEDRMQDTHNTHKQHTRDLRDDQEKKIDQLNKKLRWYGENQHLLDKDSHSLKVKDTEITQLKQRIKQLTTESGAKAAESKQRTHDRAADAKRIQDLERQVREMENIVKKRHPNSLPVLMWAASTAQDPGPGGGGNTQSVQYLERRIAKLEQELESKDEEGARSLRVLEQKYNAMKLQYEERIESLEKQVAMYQGKDSSHPHTHAGALQKQLDSVKERHKKTLTDMEKDMEKLRKEVTRLKSREQSASRNDQRAKVEHEADMELRVKALQREVTAREHDMETMQITIDRLNKEKQQMAIDATRQAGRAAKATNEKFDAGRTYRLRGGKARGAGRKDPDIPSSSSSSAAPPPPPMDLPAYEGGAMGGKEDYEPHAFTGQHVEDILREKQELVSKIERLEFAADQQRVQLQRVRAEAEARERQLREDTDAKFSALKTAHQKEVQNLLVDHSLQHSHSQLAELQSKTHTQEVVIERLREQMTTLQVDSEQMSVLRINEAALETQVRQLQDDLREARKSHTPEMRHFEALQDKVRAMDQRHEQRERELQQVIRSNTAAARHDLTSETAKWKRLLEVKNIETDRFRSELDAILGVLKELQKQGVIIPTGQGGSRGSSYR